MKTIARILISFASVAIFSLVAADFTGIPDEIILIGIIAASCLPGVQGSVLTAINITELTTKLGDYFRKQKNVLISEILLGMNIEDRMEVWDDIKDECPLPNLSLTDLVKPANPNTFSPTANSLNFGARILKARPWKVDLQLVPQTLEKTWLGFLNAKGSDPFELPFEQFIFQYITDKIHENVRLKALYKGVYNGAGTAPQDIMDGLLTLIANEITGGAITPVTTGVITSTNIIDSIEKVYDALGEAYKASPVQILVAPDLFDFYTRRYRSLFGANSDYTGMTRGEVQLDGTLAMVKREPGMSGSQRIVVTPMSNIVYGVDSMDDANNLEVQKFDRTIKILIDAKSGIQFKEIHARALSVNEQA